MAARVVTISATYGAGGSVIGPAVAERLGLPFKDRAIPAAVAATLDCPLEQALAHDQRRPGLLDRMLRAFAMGQIGAEAAQVGVAQASAEDAFQHETEQALRKVGEDGGVLLGRAAALVLAEHPEALHVRLVGPKASRLRWAMAHDEVDEAEATKRMDETDRAREDYVRHFYRTEPSDPRHYHLVIDATRLGVEATAALIVATAQGLASAG